MFKTILSELYLRIFVARKTTFLGLAFEAADIVLTKLDVIPTLPSWAHAAIGLVSTVLVLYRSKVLPPTLTPVP